MSRYKIYAISAMFIAIVSGCEKELDFKYKDIGLIPVIEGVVTCDGIAVSITLTTPMGEPMGHVRRTDASVMVSDITSGKVYALHPDADGVFRSSESGVVGNVYRLSVERGGESYAAESPIFAPVEIEPLEFGWIKMPYDYVAVLQVSFSDDEAQTGECYWIRVYRNGEPYAWRAVTDNFAVAGRIDEMFMTSRKDTDAEDDADVLFDGDVMSVSVARIPRRIYDYLEALTGGGSNGPVVFEGDYCLGYFLAASVTSESIVFRSGEIAEFSEDTNNYVGKTKSRYEYQE